MKLVVVAAMLALSAVAATAQDAALVATPVAAEKFNLDTPIATIAADPAGLKILDTTFPGMTAHPAYDQFKAMSLTELLPVAQGQITEEQLTKAAGELATIE